MPESVAPGDRRASRVAAAGLALQLLVLFLPTFVLAAMTKSESLRSEVAHLSAGIPIWLALWAIYAQRRRARVEQFETEELRRTRAASAAGGIFDTQSEQLLIERRRLNWLNRWVVPTFTILLALYLLAWFQSWVFQRIPALGLLGWREVGHVSPALFVAAGAGFVAFLYSRYTIGMARQPQWRLMRAGGGYLMGNALAFLAIVVALGFRAYGIPQVEVVVAHAIPFLMLFLGLEFLINLVLDFYRPKLPDEEPQLPFDSRLMALISDPGGIARNIAEAINYQFGFEVTRTWFYLLLKRWLMPLTAFTILALFLLSSVVIVDADQQAIIEHCGRPPAAGVAALEPGLHFKWPWPFDVVRRESVKQIHEIVLGTHKEDEKEEQQNAPILWTERHEFVPEMMLLLATPELASVSRPPEGTASAPADSAPSTQHTPPLADRPPGALTAGRAVGVSLLMVSIPIDYRIKQLRDYLYNYANPEAVMEAVAYRALTEYGAAQDIQGIMGPERADFNASLRQRLQKEYDDLHLGVEITFLGLQDAHPPADSEVAKTFQDVITAEQKKEATIRDANGQAEVKLTETAGSTERADVLDDAIRQLEAASSDPEGAAATVAAARRRVDDLLLGNVVAGVRGMGGIAAALISQTRAEQIRLVNEKQTDAAIFANQVIAYQAAPRVFMMRQYLDMLIAGLKKTRKFVVTTDRQKSNLVIILESEPDTGLGLPDIDKHKPNP